MSDDVFSQHAYILRQAKDAKGRAWESYCIYCGWIGPARYDILNARSFGERHMREMAYDPMDDVSHIVDQNGYCWLSGPGFSGLPCSIHGESHD